MVYKLKMNLYHHAKENKLMKLQKITAIDTPEQYIIRVITRS
jgi:hypothetical protein